MFTNEIKFGLLLVKARANVVVNNPISSFSLLSSFQYNFNLSDGIVDKLTRITGKLKKSKQSYDVFSYVSK